MHKHFPGCLNQHFSFFGIPAGRPATSIDACLKENLIGVVIAHAANSLVGHDEVLTPIDLLRAAWSGYSVLKSSLKGSGQVNWERVAAMSFDSSGCNACAEPKRLGLV